MTAQPIPPHLEGALKMAKRGVKVFPVLYLNGKTQPALKDPFGIATTNPEQIEKWSKEYALFGVACGESNLCVVDIDVKNGKNGFESWGQEYPQINLESFSVLTPSTGLHVYLEGTTRSAISHLTGVDIKSAGGFVVCPGSSKAGRPYQISADINFAPIPPTLRERLSERKVKDSTAAPPEIDWDNQLSVELAEAYLSNEAPPAIEGESGDATTYKVACRLKDLGISQDKSVALMDTLYNPRCEPAWNLDELTQKVQNAYQYGFEPAGSASPATHFGLTTSIIYHRASELDISAIPPRKWILRNRLVEGFISGCVGPGGLGKSTLTMAEAFAVCTEGKIPCGAEVESGGAIWIHNTEDPVEEIRRRIAAFASYYGFRLTQMPHDVFYTSGREFKIILAVDHKGFKRNEPMIAEIKKFIRERNILVWVVDPLVQIHKLDENSNQLMASLMAVFQEITEETNCAVNLAHHTRKLGSGESAGNMEVSRGAIAVMNACRMAYTLACMSRDEAKAFGIDPSKRRSYVRVDNAKNNLSAPAEHATWMQRKSVALMNGDSVGVIDPIDFDHFESERNAIGGVVCRELDKKFDCGEIVDKKTVARALMITHDVSVGGPKDEREAISMAAQILRGTIMAGQYSYFYDGSTMVRADALFG